MGVPPCVEECAYVTSVHNIDICKYNRVEYRCFE